MAPFESLASRDGPRRLARARSGVALAGALLVGSVVWALSSRSRVPAEPKSPEALPVAPSGRPPATSPAKPRLVARVGDRALTSADLERYVRVTELFAPSGPRDQALGSLVTRTLLL